MSAQAKIRTFPVNTSGSYVLPFDVATADDLQVFNSDKDCETRLTLGADYIPALNGKAVLSIQTTKPFDGFITVACVPCMDVRFQKFGAQMLPELNAQFERMAQYIGYLEARIDQTVRVPIGYPGEKLLTDDRPLHDFGVIGGVTCPADIVDYGDLTCEVPEDDCPTVYCDHGEATNLNCYCDYGDVGKSDCFVDFGRTDVDPEPEPVWVPNVPVCDFGEVKAQTYSLNVKGCCDAS